MIVTKEQMDCLCRDNWYCVRLTNAQVEELLRTFGTEPDPYTWTEEDFWIAVKKMVQG